MLTAAAPRQPVRVMVVDDSVVVRGFIGRWIAAEPGLSLVASAPDGRAALDLLAAARPDIVLLDLDMPGLDGLALMPLLLQRRPGISVVVVSTLTRRNAEISLRCLSLGAVDYLPKPSAAHDLAAAATFRAELMAKLDGLASRHERRPGPAVQAARSEPGYASRGRPDAPLPVQALVIGASTGGPRAVIEILRGLGDAARRVPILLVQHMPPIFTAVFAGQIAQESGMAAAEGRDGEPVEPGRVFVAPGGRHMGLVQREGGVVIRVDDAPPLRHCRPAVDVLFRDAADIYGPGALAVVLTGMGQDGLEGARALAGTGATVLAQDEASSVVWGMPGSILRAGLADEVVPLDRMAGAIEARINGRGTLERGPSRAVA